MAQRNLAFPASLPCRWRSIALVIIIPRTRFPCAIAGNPLFSRQKSGKSVARRGNFLLYLCSNVLLRTSFSEVL